MTFNSGGDTEQTFTVTARPDDDNDDGESVKLTFGTLPDAVTASGATETTIEIRDDDDPQVTVSFEKSSYRVAEGGSVTVTVTLSADPERDVTVGISATGQGGATGQDETAPDYSGVPDNVTFIDGGELSQTFTITAVDDAGDDDGESILLGFGNVPTGITRGTGATVTIDDDDVPDVVVSFAAATYDVDEGASVRVTVKLDKDPERQVVIPITTSDQGATPVLDYSGVPTSVTFESGDTEKVITFGATQDTLNDDGESVVIGFGSPLPSQVSRGTPAQHHGHHWSMTTPRTSSSTSNETEYDVAEGSSVTVKVTLSARPRADGDDSDPQDRAGRDQRRLRHYARPEPDVRERRDRADAHVYGGE